MLKGESREINNMDVGRRTGERGGVVPGSVWESRMKLDEVRGGIKVFNGEESNEESQVGTATRLKKVQTTGVVASGRRKTWKSEGFEKKLILIAKGETDSQNDCDEKCTEPSVPAEELKTNTVQVRISRSEGNKKTISAIDEIDRSPIQTRKSRSDFVKGLGESIEKIEKNSLQNSRLKSDSLRMMKMNKSDDFFCRTGKIFNENSNAKSEKSSLIEKIQLEIAANGGEETCKVFGMCEEKRISNYRINKEKEEDDGDDDDYEETNGGDEEDEPEIEIEKNKIDIKRINKPASKQIIKEVRKFHQASEKSIPTTVSVKQSPASQKHSRLYQNLSKPPPNSDKCNISPENHDDLQILGSDEHNSFLENHNKLLRLVDLVMWRDVPISSFVFGIGTLVIISFSYTKEINVSFISAISYLGLVYLAAIFLYRSIVCRGVVDVDVDVDDGERYVVGEGEAIWFVKLILPYLNEFLLKLRALFCGDPGTTIKLAGLLLVLAWCGNSITIWRVAKWGFFGVFTVPKISASYSSQLTLFAKYWFGHFQDAWNSCSHKKGVTIAALIIVWKLSSVAARIWAAFILFVFVALRYYQQYVKDDASVEEAPVVPQKLNYTKKNF